MCVSLCVCLCVIASGWVCYCVCLCLYVRTCVRVYVCMCVRVYVCMSMYVYVCVWGGDWRWRVGERWRWRGDCCWKGSAWFNDTTIIIIIICLLLQCRIHPLGNLHEQIIKMVFLNIDQFILSLSMISNWFRNFKDAIINLEYSVQVLGFCFVLMLHTFVTRIKHAEEMCNFLATTFNYFAVAFNSPRQLLRTAWGRGALVQLFTTK